MGFGKNGGVKRYKSGFPQTKWGLGQRLCATCFRLLLSGKRAQSSANLEILENGAPHQDGPRRETMDKHLANWPRVGVAC